MVIHSHPPNPTSEQGELSNGPHQNGSSEANRSYRILEQYHSQPSHQKVICVGAGAAGLLLAYKMQKMKFRDYKLIVYEKNPHIAGTWYENRYPGCACDIPAHTYTYPFEPKPDFSSFYAYAPEIRQYFEDFAKKYDLHKYVKVNSKVTSAVWKEEEGVYEVELEQGGKKVRDWCHVFINAGGFLNDWKWPNIKGIHDFKGQLMHSAAWDSSCDWEGKTVAVIGTGSSSIQIVPQIQKTAKHMTAFMRSVTWISPALGPGGDDKDENTDKDTTGTTSKSNAAAEDKKEAGEQAEETSQHFFTDEEKQRFKDDPEYHLQYRKKIESAIHTTFEMYIKDSEASKGAQKNMVEEMNRRIGPGHEELKSRLIPSWPPDVTTVHKEIVEILPGGVKDESGKVHEVDILVCATGFNLAFAPRFEVKGVDGVTMKDEFDPEPIVYCAVTVPKFPNYFVINGVRGNWASGSALPTLETQVEYILKCAKKMQEEQIRALEVKTEPTLQLNAHIDAWHPRTVWSAPCKSWYKNNIPDGKVWVWGGSALHHMKTIKEVKFEHYDIRYKNGNMWAFLGDGRVEAEVNHDLEHLTPYVRNEDVPFDI
ncbi:hypothetical protein BLS_007682 [Venturia inaequalis]|uniref:Sterigmatocystin biosynthesis monooxygenase stcW n=1 Tax=Venturia inaequalis TaxID=5025 RepID=A0A8H3U927_VENIN|nr:hypothetical protein BLS_007682 [Venturia inaequalis]KAE9970994.1 hypothetical protein EG327_010023 [Venturia inaequalis]